MHHITINMFCKKYAGFFFFDAGHFIMNIWNFSAFMFVYERLFFSAPDIVYSGLNRCHALMAC